MNEFSQRKTFGKRGQDVIVNFLERHFGYKFEAGERYDSILNVDMIEEIEHCEYIPPSIFEARGPKLKFRKNGREYNLTMPDVLMSRNSSSGFYWIEAKRHETDYMKLIIDADNFDDYRTLYENFTRQEFYVMCLNPNGDSGMWDIYFCDFSELIKTTGNKETIRRNNVITWSIAEVMKKLNKYPISISKYE